MTERELPRRATMPAATARADAFAPQATRGPAPAMPGTVRTVIRVGPGSRPAARLSPIATGPGRPPAPRAAPPQPLRPMHPPIARVMTSPGVGATALQAQAVATRPGPGTPAASRGMAATATGAGTATPGTGGARLGFGMPSLRRNVCPHFFMSGARGAIPIQAPHLLKALVRQEANLSRCQLRGGVHLEQGYVNDVCLSARFNQCVFYEDELSR
ncbi:MAG TPA: hypothetical protein VER83_03415 [Candidatus Nanopelagicales bacterium]|nr:hypothetical protein [Candidatus Nanopelagicales bacterium]